MLAKRRQVNARLKAEHSLAKRWSAGFDWLITSQTRDKICPKPGKPQTIAGQTPGERAVNSLTSIRPASMAEYAVFDQYLTSI